MGVLLSLASTAVWGQTQLDLHTQSRNIDFSNAAVTRPLKAGAFLPAACTLGDLFYMTSAPAGANIYGCTAQNTWTAQAGAGLYDEGASGSVDRTYSDKLRESVSARDFGAAGDGVTDDTAAFQAAFAAASLSGYAIEVPAGTYVIRPLTNPANLSLKCDPGSRFQLASGAGAEAEWLFSLAPGDTMQGCVLEGNFAGNSTAVSVAGLRIAEGASGITIDGVTISDFSGPGIYAYGAAGNLTVRNSWIYGTCNSGTGATLNCGGIYVLDEDGPSGTQFVFTGNIIDNRSTNSGGLKVQADCGSTLTDVQTSNNIIYVGNAGASDALGIEYFASPGEVCPSGQDGALTHGVINGNILEGAGSPYTFGISLGGGSTQPAATGVSDIVIDGNTVNNFAYDAVEVTGANSVVVSNNQINASGPIAITSNAAAQGIANISVRGNNISRSVASSSCSGDICATANMYPLTGITIAQNSIRGSAKDAIDLIASNSGVLSDAIVDGNVIVSPAAYAISATDYVANLSVSGNLADMTGSTMATNGAITIQGSNSNNASVCGNTVLSSPAYAIFINNNPPNDRICGNTVASSLNGIYCMSCGNAAITQNVLTGASKGSGLVLTSAVNTLVFGNAISGFATNLSLGTSTLAPLSVAGHYATAGSAPSLSACGSGASVSGTDSRGAFSEGALAAGCTVTFAAAYPAAPFCTVTSRNGAAFTYAVTSATIVVTNAGTVSGALDYSCGQ